MLEKITEQEIEMMDFYRNTYAFDPDGEPTGAISQMPIKELLQTWEQNKSILYSLLGNELIISKDFEYTKSIEELQEEVANLYWVDFGRKCRNGKRFYETYTNYIETTYPYTIGYINEKRKGLYDLISEETLVTNRYDGPTFYIKDSNDKPLKIEQGCKASKILGKIAATFNLEGYEDFRICHSQILNQKKVKGTMHLSIHPLDYWTMSDNDCGWSSCMSWSKYECHRQGTVEMMNSPTVIVAYLTADNDMTLDRYENYYWYNKKWRQLFVVDEKILLGIKSYPFYNDTITTSVLNWIKELAEQNLNWKYNSDLMTYQHKVGFELDDKIYHLKLLNYSMYSDLGCTKTHWMYINKDKFLSYDCNENDLTVLLEYSGPSQCMECGQITSNFDKESQLVCCDCQEFDWCCECGESCYGEAYWIDDQRYCETCYNNYVRQCIVCGEEHDKDYMIPIYIILKPTEESETFVKTYYPSDNIGRISWVCNSFTNSECLQNWKKIYLKPDKTIKLLQNRYVKLHCVYYEDLNENGLSELVYDDNEEDLESYFVNQEKYNMEKLEEI